MPKFRILALSIILSFTLGINSLHADQWYFAARGGAVFVGAISLALMKALGLIDDSSARVAVEGPNRRSLGTQEAQAA